MSWWDMMYCFSPSLDITEVLFEINGQLLLLIFVHFKVVLAKKPALIFFWSDLGLINLKDIFEVDLVFWHNGIGIQRTRLK